MYERYLELLEENNCKSADVARETKIHPSTFTDWKKGKSSPKIDKLQKIAEFFNVNIEWLTGVSDEKERPKDLEEWNKKLGILPIAKQKLPLLGEVACGQPIFANEERESYIEAGTNIQADFCLKAKGDSMINARIHDGDIIFIRKQNTVNNGEIAVVIIDDSMTLKRVFYYPDDMKLVLQAENPKYEPLVYVNEELEQIHILGKAVAFQSDVL